MLYSKERRTPKISHQNVRTCPQARVESVVHMNEPAMPSDPRVLSVTRVASSMDESLPTVVYPLLPFDFSEYSTTICLCVSLDYHGQYYVLKFLTIFFVKVKLLV